MRIGHGYDVHRLVEGRKLILGGVEIPFEKGLDGHSDADVQLRWATSESCFRTTMMRIWARTVWSFSKKCAMSCRSTDGSPEIWTRR